MIDRTLSFSKRYLFWPVIVPVGVMVCVDYVALLGVFIKFAAAVYMALWWLAGLLGVWAGIMTKLSEKSAWKTIFDYRIGVVVPAIRWGHDLTHWLLSEKPKEVPCKEEGGVHQAPDADPGRRAPGEEPREGGVGPAADQDQDA